MAGTIGGCRHRHARVKIAALARRNEPAISERLEANWLRPNASEHPLHTIHGD